MDNFNKSRFDPRQRPQGKSGGGSGGPGRGRPTRGGKKPNARHIPKPPAAPKAIDYDDTGQEAAYLKSLVEAETKVVVVLKTGENLHGIIRYYDRDVFSLGPADGGPKLFLRKTGVRYLYEE